MKKSHIIVLALLALSLTLLGIMYALKDTGGTTDAEDAPLRSAVPSTESSEAPSAPAPAESPEKPPAPGEQEGISEELAAKLEEAIRAALENAISQGANPEEQFPPYTSEDLPEDNGAHFFLLATELMPEGRYEELLKRLEELREAGFPRDPEFEALLAEFAEAFEAIRAGLEVGNAQMPAIRSLAEEMPYLAKFRDLGRVLALGAEYYAGIGETSTALGDLVTVMDFANESARGGVLISGLVAYAINGSAAETLRNVLARQDVTPEQYRALIGEMQALDAQLTTAYDITAAEAEALRIWIESEMGSTGSSLRETFAAAGSTEFDSMLSTISDAQLESYFLETVNRYFDAIDYVALPYHELQAISGQAAMGDSNPIAQLIMPGVMRVPAQEARASAFVRGTMLMAAIEHYGAENGTYPESLDEIMSGGLSELPVDPFTGEAFRYAATESGYVLYSAGPDMQDDGGVPLGANGTFSARAGDLIIHGE